MKWLNVLEPLKNVKEQRGPLYLRIAEALRSSIESGALLADEKLPPDRELAKLLRIDRSTIARAYDRLEAEGFVSSHVGRGTFVKWRLPAGIGENTGAGGLSGGAGRRLDLRSDLRADSRAEFAAPGMSAGGINWSEKFSRVSQDVSLIAQRQLPVSSNADVIGFTAGAPTDEFFPQSEFKRIAAELLDSYSAPEIFGYSPPEGHPLLREQVRLYLREQGIEVADSELLILSGSQQGIDLTSRTLIDPQDVVLLEDPTYFWAIGNFTACGARCLPIASDEQGLRLDQFEKTIARVQAKLLYTMPSFQNPTGSTMPLVHRRQLLALAKKYRVAILEDNFVGDLAYGKPIPSLRSLDQDGSTVIYQGTISKSLCPGLRLGWLVAPAAVMSRLQIMKRTCDLSTNSLAQLILAEYLRDGLYQEHLAMVQAHYAERLQTMCQALEEHAGDLLTWEKPAGGMYLWAKLPSGYSARELFSFAEREGVTFSPGDVYFATIVRPEYLRLTFIQQTPERIVEGIARLGRALRGYVDSRKSSERSRNEQQGAGSGSMFI